jgi:hypothetical protein
MKLFGDSKQSKPFLVNQNANYKFAELAKMPETQVVMLVRRAQWLRLPEYIENFEALTSAGRFGARPGDYEWEWIADPEGVRWWRRASSGQESLFGMAVGVHRKDMVEVYGLVEVDENSPHWIEVIPEEAANAMPEQAKLMARSSGGREEEILFSLYRDFFRGKGMLTLDKAGQAALRRGTIREVERFRDALLGLLERAGKTRLPSETR